MVCLTADGDVTVRALMEAILFWQSGGDLFVWEDTDERGGQRNDPSVNTKRTSFSRAIGGIQNCNVKKGICFFNVRATLYV